jgi:hypothetical protein
LAHGLSKELVSFMAPYLARIDLYPIKSLDGLSVSTATVLPSGALQHDRTWALWDAAGQVVNGKQCAAIHRVRSQFSPTLETLTVWTTPPDARRTFSMSKDLAALAAWFSDTLQQPIHLQQNLEQGFPDDTASPGPTVISTATLQTVADWYGWDLAETRRRFRTNLEIDGIPAFWEDRLFTASGEPVPFQIGPVSFLGINPCQRCVVPTRNTQTGAATAGFQQQFVQQRAATLPADVARSRFNHFYRLAVNTRLGDRSATPMLTIGDTVTLPG